MSLKKFWKSRPRQEDSAAISVSETYPKFVPDGSTLFDPDFPNCTQNWLIAGWVNSHICGNKEYFTIIDSIPPSERTPVKPDKATTAYPIGKGTVVVEAKMNGGQWETIRLHNVLYIPGSPNLISTTQLQVAKYFVDLFKSKLANSVDSRKDIKFWQDSGALYANLRPVCLPEYGSVNIDEVYNESDLGIIWHLRLAHTSSQILCSAINLKIYQSGSNKISDFSCKWCTNAPAVIKNEFKDTDIYQLGEVVLIHLVRQDKSSLLKSRFSVLLQDKATSFMWASAARNVKHVVKLLRDFFKKFERQYATKIQTLKFTNAVDTKILARVQSAGNQSNVLVLAYQHDVDQGISSTFLQVLDRMATIMALGNLPTTIWNFLLSTATAIQNIQPTVEATTPYEILKKSKPSVAHWRIIGSSVIPYDPKQNKVGNWILVGYNGERGYVLYNTMTEKIITTDKALVFEEEKFAPYLRQTLKEAPAYVPLTHFANVLPPSSANAPPLSPVHTTSPPPAYKPSAPCLDVVSSPPSYQQSIAPACVPIPLSRYVASSPHASLLEPQNRQITSSNVITKEDTLFVFDKLRNSDMRNRQLLKDILEPFEKKLNNFERECQSAVVYSKTSTYPRSDTLNGLSLAAKQEFETLVTQNNGQCLFNSISIALFGCQKYSYQIRLLIFRHVMQNWQVLSANSKKVFGKNLEDLIETIVEVQLWGIGAHIFILSEILARPVYTIAIHENTMKVEKQIYNSNPSNERRPPIYLMLYNHHFEALVPKPFQIITSITRKNSLNFFENTDHKYIYNGNLNVATCFYEPEIAKNLYPDLNHESKTLNSPALTVDLTDHDDDEAEKVFSCLNCKSNNQRLKEMYASNADLGKKLREKISSEIHKNNLPIVPCESCTELACRAQALEVQANQLREQFNRRGEFLIQKNQMLNNEINKINSKNQELLEGQDLFRSTLDKRNAEKHLLEQELVVLAIELERYRDFDHYQAAVHLDWSRKPSIFSPIMTPGKNLPEVDRKTKTSIGLNEIDFKKMENTETLITSTDARTLLPASTSRNGSNKSSSSNGSPSTSRISSHNGTSAGRSICLQNNFQHNQRSPNSPSSNQTPNQLTLYPDLFAEMGAFIETIENQNQGFIGSHAKGSRSQSKSSTPSRQILAPEISREINAYMDLLQVNSNVAAKSLPLSVLHEDLLLSTSASSSEEPQVFTKRSRLNLPSKDLQLSNSDSSSEVGEHVFKKSKLYVSSDTDSISSVEKEYEGCSDTTWCSNSSLSSSEEEEDFSTKIASINPVKKLLAWSDQKNCRGASSNIHKSEQPKPGVSIFNKCITCGERFASLDLFRRHVHDHGIKIKSPSARSYGLRLKQDQKTLKADLPVTRAVVPKKLRDAGLDLESHVGRKTASRSKKYAKTQDLKLNSKACVSILNKCVTCGERFASMDLLCRHLDDHGIKIKSASTGNYSLRSSRVKKTQNTDLPATCANLPKKLHHGGLDLKSPKGSKSASSSKKHPKTQDLGHSDANSQRRFGRNKHALISKTESNPTASDPVRNHVDQGTPIPALQTKRIACTSKTYTEPYTLRNGKAISLTIPNQFKNCVSAPGPVQPQTSDRKKNVQTKPAAKKANKQSLQTEQEKKFCCEKCENKYTAKSSLVRHMETHAQFRVPCRLCHLTFSTHENMVKHAKNLHNGDRTQKCRFCPHTLKKSQKSMKSHEMTAHFKMWAALENQSNSFATKSDSDSS